MTAKQRLEATLWDIANTLLGKMSADDLQYLSTGGAKTSATSHDRKNNC